jgi:hypothetical protein
MHLVISALRSVFNSALGGHLNKAMNCVARASLVALRSLSCDLPAKLYQVELVSFLQVNVG